jgi:hypothetical protein
VERDEKLGGFLLFGLLVVLQFAHLGEEVRSVFLRLLFRADLFLEGVYGAVDLGGGVLCCERPSISVCPLNSASSPPPLRSPSLTLALLVQRYM